ncbi:MAG: SGNH/GDSL hydrolase family protein [bacterium]|nr:SGNH/GDSL hydrolase family protein [bacterium]
MKLFSKRLRSNLIALALGLFLSLVFLVLVELLFAGINNRNEAPYKTVQTPPRSFIDFDYRLAYRPRPNTEVTVRRTCYDEVIYEARYTFDEHSRRVTPAAAGREGKDFVAFFGDSFTVGFGVNDDETLPNQVALRASDRNVVNFGFDGYGPQQALVQMTDPSLEERLPQGKGIGIYVLLPRHVRRAVGSMHLLTTHGRHFPLFVPDGEGGLVRKGSFHSEKYRLVRFYDYLAREQMIQYFHVDFPVRMKAVHIAHAVKMIEETRDAFEARYGDGTFHVLLYPDCKELEVAPSALVKALAESNLQTLDYSVRVDLDEEGLFIPRDGHPAPPLHARVAEWLGEDLGLGEE